ncbi:MAG TPA: glycine cleavage T C-terminal barrel domain-containing protein [Streptosporangiaceae bacterium]
MWEIRARRVVLATGAYERPIVFPGNDRPGVMAAGAAAAYARAGALAGRRAVVFGTNDDALGSALGLLDAGVEVAAVVDVRRAGTGGAARAAGVRTEELARRGVAVWAGCAVVGTEADGDGGLAAVRIAEVAPDGRVAGGAVRVECDLLGVSGGHDPAVELFTQAGGRTTWSPEAAALVPDMAGSEAGRPTAGHGVPGTAAGGAPRSIAVVGAARGTRDLSDALAEGAEAGIEAAAQCGFASCAYVPPATDSVARTAAPAAFWFVDFGRTGTAATDPDTEAFVDLNRDATLADVRRALADGMRHVEHVKRYTTIGTGADQGRTSAVLLAGVLARLTGTDMGARTTARPPVAPIRFALVAGRDRGALSDPARRTPMHDWHAAHGAEFENVGQWKRAWYYPRDGEDMAAAVRRECRAARESVAVLDYSTLGKIDVQGADTPAFLDRVYANRFATLKPGRCRYGVMCGADGMVADDGVTARLAEDRFHMTTTTGNAAGVLDAIEEWLFTEWPDLDVRATSVTEQWAVISLVGPRARDVMRTLSPGADLDGFGFMTVREMPVAGVPARVFRVSFTGELTYEINVPWWYGAAVWRAVMAAGAAYGITPYGTETMHVLRAEKGLIVAGQETDGTVTPEDVGLGWAVSKVKDFVGKRSLARPDTARADRPRLVGLLPHDPGRRLSEGAQLVAGPDAVPPLLGHVTSAYDSAALGRTFALALLSGGADRQGATVYAVDGDAVIPAAVTDPVFYDRDNTRRDGGVREGRT